MLREGDIRRHHPVEVEGLDAVSVEPLVLSLGFVDPLREETGMDLQQYKDALAKKRSEILATGWDQAAPERDQQPAG